MVAHSYLLQAWVTKGKGRIEEIEEKIYQLKESFGEEAKELIDYFARLAEQTSEEELGPEFKTEELLKEIERFLKDKGEQKEGN